MCGLFSSNYRKLVSFTIFLKNCFFLVTAPECFDEIDVSECGVTANTALDQDHRPQNVLNAANTAWSPAIRMGKGWNDHIRFDFRTNTRITKLKIILKSNSKKPKKVSVQVSNSDVSWTMWSQQISLQTVR